MKCKCLYPALVLMLLASCKGGNGESQYVTEVNALTVAPTTSELTESYTASIRGRQDIDIYPQVEGKIVKVCIIEGQKVRAGQVLFILDQVPYQAALRTATANVHAARTAIKTAQLELRSKEELLQENVISEYEVSMARNQLAVAEAQLEQAQAAEINARNSLSYTEVKSPSEGVVGTLPYKVGALVSPALPQPLTVISDNSQMYVYFSMTENQLRALMREYGTIDRMIGEMPAISLQLNDGSIYDEKGSIESVSGIINDQTGTVSLRSVFPNADRMLFSGGIGNVLISHTDSSAIVIPQIATYELQDKVFVYAIRDGKTNATEIKVSKLNNGKDYLVIDGLNVGDVIVAEGVGTLREGANVIIKKPQQ